MKQGILDLEVDSDYVSTITCEDGKTEIVVRANRSEGQTKVRVTVQHKEKVPQELSEEDTRRLVKDLMIAMFLTTEIPAEAVPEQIRSSLRVSSLWVREQAQMVLPMMLQTLMDIEVVDGIPFHLDLGYRPNILSTGLVDLQGQKKDKWLGSFRPIIVLNEVQNLPEHVGGPVHGAVDEGRSEAHQHIAAASPAEVIAIGSKARRPE